MDLQIIIKGYVSEKKSTLADDLRDFMIKRGYGEVIVTGKDNGEYCRGVSKEESIEIIID